MQLAPLYEIIYTEGNISLSKNTLKSPYDKTKKILLRTSHGR